MAVNAGRWGVETPVWLSGQRTIVFADALTERGGALRIWSTPWDEEGPRRVLRQLLHLPFKRVIISHGRPVHDRAAYARALELDPWMSDELSEWTQQIQSSRQLIGLEPWPQA
jgi:glyoxylase-like metal-dependent hydrolase (beta-lactamase superfamily II)